MRSIVGTRFIAVVVAIIALLGVIAGVLYVSGISQPRRSRIEPRSIPYFFVETDSLSRPVQDRFAPKVTPQSQ